MIIGLSGYKQSGKDTIAAYLVKEHGFERKAFADSLKQSIAALFDIPFADVDKLKLDTTIGVAIGPQESNNSIIPMYRSMTFRELLQRYGTEAHRDIFGYDFWLDHTLPGSGYYPGRAIVVSDVRFRNEAERVRILGGVNWRIHRESAPENTEQHSSEEFDYDDLIDAHIDNESTLEELFENVENCLTECVQVYGTT